MITFTTIFFIAIALSLDAFAVSIASGIIIKRQKIHHALRFSGTFAFFQMAMPILGWMGGRTFHNIIDPFSHWLAFFLLIFVGIKIIYEALKIEKYEEADASVSVMVLIGLGIATSMDALAVGLSLSFIDISILKPSLIIGIVTFLMSFLGFFIGDRFGHIFEKKVEIVAGLILIAIAFKILLLR